MGNGMYTINLLCTNCNHKWREGIPKGNKFFSRGLQQAAGYGHNSWDAHDNQINCPNCDCNAVRSENWDETNQRLSNGDVKEVDGLADIHKEQYDVLVRTPMICQNKHHRWLYHLISRGDSRTIWGPSCDCPAGELDEGFKASGPSQLLELRSGVTGE